VGAGLVGGEVSATAVGLGHAVTVVEAAPDPFVRQFGALCAARLVALHESYGVRIVAGTTVERLAPAGRGGAALLGTGELVPTDVVVVGIGAVPNVDWLAGSGVDVDDGVVTDGAGRTSVVGVVAAGDVARYSSPSYGSIRVEHWTNARDMPPVAVSALLDQLEGGSPGAVLGYDPVPYFWSTQYGRHLQLAGHPGTGDAMEFVDGDVATDRFAARETLGGLPVAAIGWDSPRAFGRLRRELRDSRGGTP
jgi:NADPH-dependent 2,4-dienoyl-CoA reductase/sulfur reductase-like enzyme